MKRQRLFDVSFIVFLGIAVGAGLAVYLLKGSTVFFATLIADMNLFVKILPLIGGGILLVGFLQVLIPSGFVARWLGKESGLRGILVATLAGAVTPGGPMISFPMVLALRAGGADSGALVAYLTAWTTIGLSRTLAWELSLMGPEFTAVRLGASLILPVLAGMASRKLGGFEVKGNAEQGNGR